MPKQKFDWTINLILFPILAWSLFGCGGPSNAAAPSATTAPAVVVTVTATKAPTPTDKPAPTPTATATETAVVEEVALNPTETAEVVNPIEDETENNGAANLSAVDEADIPGVEYWGSLPSPDDVFNLNFESNGLEDSLTATSFSDLPAVLALYRQELPRQGWQEKPEAAVIEETTATLLFEGQEILLRLELSQPPDSLTDIRLTTTVAAGAASHMTLDELPRPENIKVLLEKPDFLRYDAASDQKSLLEFYRQELTALGWQEQMEFGYIQDQAVLRFFRKGNFSVSLLLLSLGDDTIGVDLELRDLAAEAAATEATETAQANLPPLVAGETVTLAEIALPLPDQALEVEIAPTTLNYRLTSDPALIFEFYHQALSASDWRQIEAGSEVDSAVSKSTYRFTNADENLFLLLTLSRDIPATTQESNEMTEVGVLIEVTNVNP